MPSKSPAQSVAATKRVSKASDTTSTKGTKVKTSAPAASKSPSDAARLTSTSRSVKAITQTEAAKPAATTKATKAAKTVTKQASSPTLKVQPRAKVDEILKTPTKTSPTQASAKPAAAPVSKEAPKKSAKPRAAGAPSSSSKTAGALTTPLSAEVAAPANPSAPTAAPALVTAAAASQASSPFSATSPRAEADELATQATVYRVPAGSETKGDIGIQGDALIAGRFIGVLRSERGTITILDTAEVCGHLEADYIKVQGRVICADGLKSVLVARRSISAVSSARIEAEVWSRSFGLRQCDIAGVMHSIERDSDVPAARDYWRRQNSMPGAAPKSNSAEQAASPGPHAAGASSAMTAATPGAMTPARAAQQTQITGNAAPPAVTQAMSTAGHGSMQKARPDDQPAPSAALSHESTIAAAEDQPAEPVTQAKRQLDFNRLSKSLSRLNPFSGFNHLRGKPMPMPRPSGTPAPQSRTRASVAWLSGVTAAAVIVSASYMVGRSVDHGTDLAQDASGANSQGSAGLHGANTENAVVAAAPIHKPGSKPDSSQPTGSQALPTQPSPVLPTATLASASKNLTIANKAPTEAEKPAAPSAPSATTARAAARQQDRIPVERISGDRLASNASSNAGSTNKSAANNTRSPSSAGNTATGSTNHAAAAASPSADDGDQVVQPAALEEMVQAAQAQIARLESNRVIMLSGNVVNVGSKFKSGERLISVNPATGRLVTDRRTLVIIEN